MLAAPDKFKGTFSAAEVAAAMARGARAAGWDAVERPIADGGEGTAEALMAAHGGRWVEADAHDALGRPVRARFALLADACDVVVGGERIALPGGERTAVVEVAAASGLWRLTAEERDAFGASSRGTGELIAAAVAAGAETVIVAAGGSATTDAGQGAIDVVRGLDRLPHFVVACDTAVPFEHAPSVYGPQKGARPAEVAALEARLDGFAAAAPRDPRGLPMSGAAGGLAGGLWAWCGAELVGGAALLLDALALDVELARADMVLTGEGCIDAQTLTGKGVGELAGRCVGAGIPCAAIVGRAALTRKQRDELGLVAIAEATSLDAIAAAAAELLTHA